MVVPVFGSQYHRDARGEQHGHHSRHHTARFRLYPTHNGRHSITQSHDTDAYPYAEGVEGSGVDVVTLARLIGGGVEVYHQRDTHHHEEEHHDDEVTPVVV